MLNNKKKILILSPFFFPEPISTGKFNTDIAKALVNKNCNITILCSHPFYPKWKPQKSNDKIEGITIVRGGLKIKYPNNTILKRALLEIWYALFVFRQFLKLRNNIDIIIPVFPPSLAFYVIIPFIKKQIHMVGMVHDLQEVYSKKKSGLVNKIIRFLINKIEGKSLRSCNKLIFLSQEMKETAKKYYKLNVDYLEVQYPFITLDTKTKTNELEDILLEDNEHVIYSGALGEKQNPYKIYEFYNFASQKISNTEFHFFSQGTIFENLKNNNKNEKIKFHDLVPEKNLSELYRRSTVQMLPQLQGTSQGSLPSKLPNLLISGCNIMAITDKNSEIYNLFNKYNLNCVVNSWNNEELCNALKKILNKGNIKNENHIKVAEKNFQIDFMVEKLLSI